MKIYKVGDHGKAICDHCQAIEPITYKLRDVPFSDGSGIVKGILVGVCDKCDSVVLTPRQSTPAIRRQLQKQRKSLESRVPAHMVDILNLACDELGTASDFTPDLVKFYIHQYSQGNMDWHELKECLSSELAQGKAEKRISIKGQHVTEEAENLWKQAGLKNKGDVVRAVILKIYNDILEKNNPAVINQLRGIVAAVS